jgi:hypothetical protein
MDYSLVVGVDGQNDELVVGIVGRWTFVHRLEKGLVLLWQTIFELTHGTSGLRLGSKNLLSWQVLVKGNQLL